MKITAFAIVLTGILWAGFGHSDHQLCDPEAYAEFVEQTLHCVDQMALRGFGEEAITTLCHIRLDCPPPPPLSPLHK